MRPLHRSCMKHMQKLGGSYQEATHLTSPLLVTHGFRASSSILKLLSCSPPSEITNRSLFRVLPQRVRSSTCSLGKRAMKFLARSVRGARDMTLLSHSTLQW